MLVIPVLDEAGQAQEVYGRKVNSGSRGATHLYRTGPHAGVFNPLGIKDQAEVILCESLIDALTFWCAGIHNVTTSYGTGGLTDEIVNRLAGAERIREIVKSSQARGVNTLTLFAFSRENWKRPPREVEGLMRLFYNYLKKEAKGFFKEGIRLKIVGSREHFSPKILAAIEDAERIASTGDFNLVIAADYSGRWDIADATKHVVKKVIAGECSIDDIDENMFDQYVSTSDLPPLDLLIRTGGEYRISNFLLWQAAYAELYFSPFLWPEFTTDELYKAFDSFDERERRYGKTSDQLKNERDGA